MLEISENHKAKPHARVDHQVQTREQVNAGLIRRVLQVFVREKLLASSSGDNAILIDLKKNQCQIVISDVKYLNIGKFNINGEVLLVRDNYSKAIVEVDELLKLIEDELADEIDSKQWGVFCNEIANCLENDIAVTDFSNEFNEKLAEKIIKSHGNSLVEYISKDYAMVNQIAFFEMWATNGHPVHPCHKTRFGFSSEDYLKYSPEFDPDIAIPLVAIENKLLHVESEQKNLDYNLWFAKNYPLQWTAFKDELINRRLLEINFHPIFVHPWQYEHVLTKLFSELIDSGKLILFKDIRIITKASLSFRTMIVKESLTAPHIKLPVGVHSTSALRVISPASIVNGPKLTAILREILRRENNFGQRLRLACETCSVRINHTNPETAKHLAIIYRQNPAEYISSNQMPIVAAALFQPSPIQRTPLFIEIIQAAGCKHISDALRYFDNYCRTIIQAYLDLLLIYGIALEGHQQNTIVVFEDFKPSFAIARDLGALRIDLPTLQSQGFTFEPFPNSPIISADSAQATNKFLDTVVQLHLGELATCLAEYYQVPENRFWQLIGNNLQTRFQELKDKVESQRWKQEYEAMLENDWEIRAVLRMRLNNQHKKYIYVNFENPLRELTDVST